MEKWSIGGSELDAWGICNLLLRYKAALEGLTPGGSEYVNEPERCALYVRDRVELLTLQLANAVKAGQRNGERR